MLVDLKNENPLWQINYTEPRNKAANKAEPKKMPLDGASLGS